MVKMVEMLFGQHLIMLIILLSVDRFIFKQIQVLRSMLVVVEVVQVTLVEQVDKVEVL